MRADIFYKIDDGLYKLAWLNESPTGVYMGQANLGISKDFHYSYHADGNTHFKSKDLLTKKYNYLAESVLVGVKDVEGTLPIHGVTMPLINKWLKAGGKVERYNNEHEIIILDNKDFEGFNHLVINFSLISNNSEEHFLSLINPPEDLDYKIISYRLINLANFKEHSLGIVFYGSIIELK